jgi:aldose 1-epimerase
MLLALPAQSTTKVTSQPFGKTSDGIPVEIFTLSDGEYEARIATYGGVLVSLKAPDRNGRVGDIVLGFDQVDRLCCQF